MNETDPAAEFHSILAETAIANDLADWQIELLAQAMRRTGETTAEAATNLEALANSITAKEKPRMKLHPEALAHRTGRTVFKTPKQLRKEAADRIAQERGLQPDAKTLYRAISTVKAEHARRIVTGETR